MRKDEKEENLAVLHDGPRDPRHGQSEQQGPGDRPAQPLLHRREREAIEGKALCRHHPAVGWDHVPSFLDPNLVSLQLFQVALG